MLKTTILLIQVSIAFFYFFSVLSVAQSFFNPRSAVVSSFPSVSSVLSVVYFIIL